MTATPSRTQSDDCKRWSRYGTLNRHTSAALACWIVKLETLWGWESLLNIWTWPQMFTPFFSLVNSAGYRTTFGGVLSERNMHCMHQSERTEMVPSRSSTVRPWKMMFGNLLSYWEGKILRGELLQAISNFGRVMIAFKSLCCLNALDGHLWFVYVVLWHGISTLHTSPFGSGNPVVFFFGHQIRDSKVIPWFPKCWRDHNWDDRKRVPRDPITGLWEWEHGT